MRLAWAIIGGLAAGIALAWWLSRDPPEVVRERETRAADAAAARAEASRPVLYRWTDASGIVHVTQDPPPKGRRYETVDIEPREGIEVDGRRR